MSSVPEDKLPSRSAVKASESGQHNVPHEIGGETIDSLSHLQTFSTQSSILFATPNTPRSYKDYESSGYTFKTASRTNMATCESLPHAGPSRSSHLPTPQSPGNVAAYFPGYVIPSHPPSALNGSRNADEEPEQAADTQEEPAWTPLGFQKVLDDAPKGVVKSRPHTPFRHLPAASLSPRPHSAPFGSSLTNKVRPRFREMTPPQSRPAQFISPPMSITSISPDISRKFLTSPFLPVSTPSKAADCEGRILQPQPTTPIKASTQRGLDVLFSPLQMLEKSTLESSRSQRAITPDRPGGELDRIRERLVMKQNTYALDLESRRPDYLKRQKRPNPSDLDVVLTDKDNESFGIVTSPMKGRRIELFDFKQTSDESFEERLMTHGYGTYGGPETPPQRPYFRAEELSQEAMDWLAFHTPKTANRPSEATPFEPKAELSEKEAKKRKRLESFMRPISLEKSKLYPVDVVGKGRMLLNVPPEEFDETYNTSPTKKRAIGRKKKGIVETRIKATPRKDPPHVFDGPKWLDQEYPWCLRERERREAESDYDKERLKFIERFLDRDTDSDEESQVEEMILSSEFDPEALVRTGRGKAVPISAEPGGPAEYTHQKETVLFPSDPADARIALMSKRSVRGYTRRRRIRAEGDEDEDISCLCGINDTDADTHLVQCDDCQRWYHMRCVGILDPSELPGENETWYCPQCMRGSSNSAPSTPPKLREPTLVPTDDILPSVPRDIAIYQSSPQSSPSRVWSSTPRTPKHNQSRSDEFISRSIWANTSSDAGPSTPFASSQSTQVYSTPSNRTDDNYFDPTSTPSRGINFSHPFVTPKSNWLSKTSLFTTPRSSGFRNPFNDDNGLPRSIFSYDDTPIRRDSGSHRAFAPQPLFDSPSVPRPIALFGSSQLEESPIARSKIDVNERTFPM